MTREPAPDVPPVVAEAAGAELVPEAVRDADDEADEADEDAADEADEAEEEALELADEADDAAADEEMTDDDEGPPLVVDWAEVALAVEPVTTALEAELPMHEVEEPAWIVTGAEAWVVPVESETVKVR